MTICGLSVLYIVRIDLIGKKVIGLLFRLNITYFYRIMINHNAIIPRFIKIHINKYHIRYPI